MNSLNNFVNNRIKEILSKYKFDVDEEYENYFKFSSDDFSLVISHNKLDKINSFDIGKRGSQSNEINNLILKRVFKTNLRFEQLPLSKFLINVEIFLNEYSNQIFCPDCQIIDIIQLITENEAKIYTNSIIESQYLNFANNAWANKNYDEFIKYMDKIIFMDLSKSMIMKYQFAKKRL